MEDGRIEDVRLWRPGSNKEIYKKCLNTKQTKLINNILLANHDNNCICTKVILNLRKITQSYFLEIKIPNVKIKVIKRKKRRLRMCSTLVMSILVLIFSIATCGLTLCGKYVS